MPLPLWPTTRPLLHGRSSSCCLKPSFVHHPVVAAATSEQLQPSRWTACAGRRVSAMPCGPAEQSLANVPTALGSPLQLALPLLALRGARPFPKQSRTVGFSYCLRLFQVQPSQHCCCLRSPWCAFPAPGLRAREHGKPAHCSGCCTARGSRCADAPWPAVAAAQCNHTRPPCPCNAVAAASEGQSTSAEACRVRQDAVARQ